MPWRFRRSFRLLPGVRLNLSRSGVSTSIGVKGAHVTIGPSHTTASVGVPGTGLSYQQTIHADGAASHGEGAGAARPRGVPWVRLLVLVALVAWLIWLIANHGGLPR